MELTNETKSNLELLDKILKYVKPSILLEIANKTEFLLNKITGRCIWDRFTEITLNDMIQNLEKGDHVSAKTAALNTIVGLMKVIEEIDKGK
jgi:hypothetical protein